MILKNENILLRKPNVAESFNFGSIKSGISNFFSVMKEINEIATISGKFSEEYGVS